MSDREVDDAVAYLAPLARMIARSCERRLKMPYGELTTQALIGAWEAVLAYDAAKSTSLWIYASRIIKHRVYDQVRTELGRHLQRSQVWMISVDSDMLRNVPCSEHGYDEVETHDTVVCVLDSLRPRHRELLKVMYFHGIPEKEIGARVRVSESRICQVHTQALREARQVLESDGRAEVFLPSPREGGMLCSGGEPVTLAYPDDS